jgi:hypothetical protein
MGLCRLDIVFDRPDQVPLAVEIDREKAWSVQKLEAETRSGSAAIWPCWGSPLRRLIPARPVVLMPFKPAGRETEQGRLYTRQP